MPDVRDIRAQRIEIALRNLLAVIAADDLIPEEVSYMRQARDALLDAEPEQLEIDRAQRITEIAKLTSEVRAATELVLGLQQDVDGMTCVNGPRPCRRCRMGARLNELSALLTPSGCEACDSGFRLGANGVHYDDARGGWTWGVCRKVVAPPAQTTPVSVTTREQ